MIYLANSNYLTSDNNEFFLRKFEDKKNNIKRVILVKLKNKENNIFFFL